MRHDLYRFSGNFVPLAAILIQRGPTGLTHTGIIYRDDQEELKLLDFLADGQIRVSRWTGKHPHVIIDLGDDSDAVSNLADLCHVIAERHRTNPKKYLYGFMRDENAYVNPITGDLYLGTGEASCASFVLIVLSSARIERVVVTNDWPYRPHADDGAHHRIIEFLRQHGVDDATLNRLRAELPRPRISPAEVAGVFMCQPHPTDQPSAERAARWVMELFDHNQKHRV